MSIEEQSRTDIRKQVERRGMSSTIVLSSFDAGLMLASGGLLSYEPTTSGLHINEPSPYIADLRLAVRNSWELSAEGIVCVDVLYAAPPAEATEEAHGLDEEVYRQALAVAEQTPAIEVELPVVPLMTGNLVTDVQALFALTVADVADLLAVTERHLYRLKQGGDAGSHRRTLQALRAVGLHLIGGLGPDGARSWLDAGEPPSRQLLADGKVDEVAARARELTDSLAT